MVWRLRRYWHFCQNCPGWPDDLRSNWRYANPKIAQPTCEVCVGLVRMRVCDEARTVAGR